MLEITNRFTEGLRKEKKNRTFTKNALSFLLKHLQLREIQMILIAYHSCSFRIKLT